MLDSPITIALKRRPLWSGRLMPFVGIAVIVLLTRASDAMMRHLGEFDDPTASADFLVNGGIALMLMGFVFRRLYRRRQPAPNIVLQSGHVSLPPTPDARTCLRLPYDEIRSVTVGGVPGNLRILIESRKRVFIYGQQDFEKDNEAGKLIEELQRRIRELPDGPKIMEEMNARHELAQRAVSVRPWMTQALLGINIIFFINQYVSDALRNQVEMLRWGAISRVLIESGDYYRLISGTFLHGHELHIALNGLGLYIVGGIVERLVGWHRFLVVYFVSAIVASLASISINANFSVGASGAIFGILGMLAFINWRYGDSLPLGFRQPQRVWILLFAINAAIPLALPIVDVAAHVAGLLAGMVTTWILYLGHGHITPKQRPSPLVVSLAVGLTALAVLSLGQAVVGATKLDREEDMRLYQALLTTGNAPGNVNVGAWSLAIDPKAPQDVLLAARDKMKVAVKQEPWSTMIRDTLATLEYRVGNYDAAVREEHIVLQNFRGHCTIDECGFRTWLGERLFGRLSLGFHPGFGPTYGTQMARFLLAQNKDVSAEEPPAPEPESEEGVPPTENNHGFSFEPVKSMVGEMTVPSLRVEIDPNKASLDQGQTVYATAHDGDALLGLVHLELGPNAEPLVEELLKSGPPELLKDTVRFRVLFVGAGPPPRVPAGKAKLAFWETDPVILKYP